MLYLFLRNGSTTGVIALSIPISMTATFGLLYFSGLTLNQMTFGGLALGIGLIVVCTPTLADTVMDDLRSRRESPVVIGEITRGDRVVTYV